MNSDYKQWQLECEQEKSERLEDEVLAAQGEVEELRNRLSETKAEALNTLKTLSVALEWISDIEIREDAKTLVRLQMERLCSP